MRRLTKIYHKICGHCKSKFESKAPNAKYCLNCRTNGFLLHCIICNAELHACSVNIKYCLGCQNLNKARTTITKEKISKNRKHWTQSDEGKSFYKKLGKENSKRLKKHFSTEKGKQQIKRVAKIQSKIMKTRIASGQWTPNITNSWTHWNAIINVNGNCYKFRSSWEACFWLCNQKFEYETLRISHGDSVVICDFVDHFDKIVIEIKPRRRYRIEKNKINSIINWCFVNNYKFLWINESNIMNYIDKTKFTDSNISQLKQLQKGIKNAKIKN